MSLILNNDQRFYVIVNSSNRRCVAGSSLKETRERYIVQMWGRPLAYKVAFVSPYAGLGFPEILVEPIRLNGGYRAAHDGEDIDGVLQSLLWNRVS